MHISRHFFEVDSTPETRTTRGGSGIPFLWLGGAGPVYVNPAIASPNTTPRASSTPWYLSEEQQKSSPRTESVGTPNPILEPETRPEASEGHPDASCEEECERCPTDLRPDQQDQEFPCARSTQKSRTSETKLRRSEHQRTPEKPSFSPTKITPDAGRSIRRSSTERE